MNDEFDYDLMPSQWEALRALRTPASPLPRLGRHAIESLLALGLIVLHDGKPVMTAMGRKVLIRGSSQLLQDLAA